nr:MAG TPA: hypothetical protein [Siphoviridae sp. ctEci12]
MRTPGFAPGKETNSLYAAGLHTCNFHEWV